jgi:alpha-tubulin suppressor-like RCC1 family protein
MGQLGDGTRSLTSIPDSLAIVRMPVRVLGGHHFTQLDAGGTFTCGTTVAGAVYCWGYGQSGETGDSTVMTYCSGPLPDPNRPCSASRPVRVLPESLSRERRAPSAVRFDGVSAEQMLACGLDNQGRAYCWGNNYRCALGRCRMPDSHRAHRIEIAGRVAEIGAGYRHACARTADGRIFCWGDNVVGQLGSHASVNLGPYARGARPGATTRASTAADALPRRSKCHRADSGPRSRSAAIMRARSRAMRVACTAGEVGIPLPSPATHRSSGA